MRKLNELEMESIKGGSFSNKQCAIMGAGTVAAALLSFWPTVISLITISTANGCFEKW